MTNSKRQCIIDGECVSAEQAVVPATSRGLMYGDGIFETLRTYNGCLFKLDEHLSRLQEGLKVLGISPPEGIRTHSIKPLLKEVLKANHLLKKDAVLRVQVWRNGGRGYLPRPDSGSHFMITASECPGQFGFPTLVTVERKRIPSAAVPAGYKFTNGINYILAAREAAAKQADDALMQTTCGHVSETTKANIFWLKDSTVYTPSDACDLLPGITRRVCIELLENYPGVALEIGKYSLDEILNAEMVWITNSVRELLPVCKINSTEFPTDGEVLLGLRNKFVEYRNRHLHKLNDG